MKRLICLTLVILTCLGCVSCAQAPAVTTPAPTVPAVSTPAPTQSAPTQEQKLWVSGETKSADRSLTMEEGGLLMYGSYSAYSNDTVFSGVHLSAVELTANAAGTLTLASVPNGGMEIQNPITVSLEQGKNLIPLSLEIPYGHTLMIGKPGDSAQLALSSDATGPAMAMQVKDGESVGVVGRFFIANRLEKNLTGLDLEQEFPIKYTSSDYYYADEGSLIFADEVANNTLVTKIKAAMSYCDPGDTLTVNVVKTELCNGQSIQETLSSHTFTCTEQLEDQWVEWECNIEVPEGYTLAFLQPEDTALLGYLPGKLGRTNYYRSLGFYHHCNDKSNYEGLRHYLLVELHGIPTETAEQCSARLEKERKLLPLSEEEKAELASYLEGKSLSLLGDSITTYTDVSNNTKINSTLGNNVVYYSPGERLYLNQTWWKLLLADTSLTLCVNNSWSGSLILGGNGNIWSGRSENLHIDTNYAAENGIAAEPDVILVWMGTNDYNGNAALGDPAAMNPDLIREENGTFVYADPTTVTEAYAISLHKMQQRYPDARIFLMSPFCIKAKNDPGSTYLATFNAALKAVGDSFGLPFIDLSTESGIDLSNNASFTHGDGLHPNEEGMAVIASCVERAMLNFYRQQG